MFKFLVTTLFTLIVSGLCHAQNASISEWDHERQTDLLEKSLNTGIRDRLKAARHLANDSTSPIDELPVNFVFLIDTSQATAASPYREFYNYVIPHFVERRRRFEIDRKMPIENSNLVSVYAYQLDLYTQELRWLTTDGEHTYLPTQEQSLQSFELPIKVPSEQIPLRANRTTYLGGHNHVSSRLAAEMLVRKGNRITLVIQWTPSRTEERDLATGKGSTNYGYDQPASSNLIGISTMEWQLPQGKAYTWIYSDDAEVQPRPIEILSSTGNSRGAVDYRPLALAFSVVALIGLVLFNATNRRVTSVIVSIDGTPLPPLNKKESILLSSMYESDPGENHFVLSPRQGQELAYQNLADLNWSWKTQTLHVVCRSNVAVSGFGKTATHHLEVPLETTGTLTFSQGGQSTNYLEVNVRAD